MKKIISWILALSILTSNIFFIVSCNKKPLDVKAPELCTRHADNDLDDCCDICGENIAVEPPPIENVEIKVPEYKDYLRGTKNFDELIYSRPDISAALSLFESITKTITENSIPYVEQLKKLNEVDAIYENFNSMSAIATIYNYKDSSNEFWKEEYRYITTNYPLFSQGLEDIFVSAASSPHKKSFEKDYFGPLDDYVDGGIYTDEVVLLMQNEALLEAEYSSISTASVTISYGNMTASYDEITKVYKEKYGETSSEYLKVAALCNELYQEAKSKIEAELLVELIKARKLISDALGYDSYEEFAYMTLYHDYKPSEMEDFLESVTEIAIPVYVNLSSELFAPYVYEYEKTVALDGIKRADVINTLYDVYKECNPTLGEIYSYMLQHGLYDVDTANGHRFNGSFTTYIDSNASPYLFATIEGTMLDYATLAHEFGHFADGYINNDSATSLDLTEVSSQALELLTILALEDRLDEESYNYLLYLKLEEILSTIIFQSFYASFEIAAYELDYEDITLENLNALVASVAKEFGFSSSCNNVGYVTIPHIFIYPFYVQSYATSAITALEIYTAEVKHEGAGFEKYTDLITRESDEILSFDEELEASYLSSPFDSGAFKKILNELHYATIGAYFYKTQGGNAA